MFPIQSAGSASGYFLQRSLRFRASASAYLNRTVVNPSNLTTWTWSGWVKRGAIGVQQILFSAGTLNVNDTALYFGANDTLNFYTRTSATILGYVATPAVYRDPSSWYHLIIVYNSQSATASNRMQIYVNGVLQTVTTINTLPQNTTSFVNSAVPHYLGTLTSGSYLDGYMAEVNFIDGQALTPSSFGSFNSTTGVWQPAKYTGSYGTNGFYLPFTNNTSPTTLGYDSSGNGNNWTPNNISTTAGVTYDSMTDVPTLTSASVSNYCTLNPLACPVPSGTYLESGNSVFYWTNTSAWISAGSTIAVSNGKYYWECAFSNIASLADVIVGIAPTNLATGFITNNYFAGQGALDYGYYNKTGLKFNNSVSAAYGASFTNGDIVGVALDMTAGNLTFYKNNTSQGVAYTGISGTYTPVVSSQGGTIIANFGQRPFTYTPPSGFVALNTYNLPTGTIVKGNTVMDATLYTGAGTTQNIVNAAGFQPDLFWLKSRSTANSHYLVDSVRGVEKLVSSDLTLGEQNIAQTLTSFNSNGVTLGTIGGGINGSGINFVGWQWKGNGTAVTNTSGTLTSQVSANTSAGFSAVTYTGNGILNASVGHGLGIAPQMIIVKSRSGTSDWIVYHAFGTGINSYLSLNTSAAAIPTTSVWGTSAPTSSVFNLYSSGATNTNGAQYIAYCFAPIAGYSVFYFYNGNGSAEGPFVYTGFRPKYVMYKATTEGGSWVVLDSARDTYNVEQKFLLPDTSGAEGTTPLIDFLSNGFKLRSNASGTNTAGQTYMFMAFAENPFRNSLAR